MSLAVAISWPWSSALLLISSLFCQLDTHWELWARGGGSIVPAPQVFPWSDASIRWVGIAGGGASDCGGHLKPMAEDLGCVMEWRGREPSLSTF